jgi:hypothetical protein
LEVVPVAGICCIADLARRIGPLGGADMAWMAARPGYWRGWAALLPGLAVLLAACATAPGFAPAVPGAQPQPDSIVYRNLAEIPERPEAPPMEAVDKTVQDLTTDRAMAAQAADALRRAPFDTPDPATLQSGL